jgi:hypothetical protein
VGAFNIGPGSALDFNDLRAVMRHGTCYYRTRVHLREIRYLQTFEQFFLRGSLTYDGHGN